MQGVHNVLVTGANGFVGSALTRALLLRGMRVRMTGLGGFAELQALGAEWFQMPDLSQDVDWRPALDGMDAVVHLAAIAHRFESATPEVEALYDRVNHQATRKLALAARDSASLARFLFISSVRVHGDPLDLPVREQAPFAPSTPYDLSKARAEAAIRELLAPESIRWAILRPVLVYGPGNRGNMAKLEGLIRAGIPIPLRKVPNRRSFLFIGNLVDAMATYLAAAEPPSGRAWIVADGEAASTERLVLGIGKAMKVKVRILHLPDSLLASAALAGDGFRKLGLPFPWTKEVRKKLHGDFYVDTSAIRDELGWTPPFSLDEGLASTFGGG